jgi:hypothetical protein
MTGTTGIELGPYHCVLVRAARRGLRPTVSAASVIGPAEWSGDRESLAAIARASRSANRLPARARVVAWATGESALAPLVEAGFEIEEVLSPPEALLRLARARGLGTGADAIAIVSVNTHGAAIAIVSGGELVSSRTFDWPLGAPIALGRSDLLDRYLIVSQLAPQLEHLIELVRPVYGARVGSVVTCGNLPDMRSLSMLLIQELDIEVDTLDSIELLDSEEAVSSVTAVQLAAAVAVQAEDPESSPTAGASAIRSSSAALAIVLSAAWAFLQLPGTSPATPLFASTPAFELAAGSPLPVVPTLRTEATMGRVDTGPGAPEAVEPAPAPPPVPVSTGSEAPPRPQSALPRVDGIIISGERQLAILDGQVVGPGDKVGPRTVARIDRDSVTLREPTGHETRVAIRIRKSPGTGIRPQP